MAPGAGVWAALGATRIGLTLVGVLALAAIPNPNARGATGVPWLDVWVHWDAGFYIQIAASGYNPLAELPNIVFFPLYPAAMRAVALPFGGGMAFYVAGIVVSLIALGAALAYLVALVRLDGDDGAGRRAALYLLAFPTTLFLSAVYPEALFLALTVAAFYYARQGRWWAVGLLGFAASLTRPHGALLAIPLAFEYLYQRGFDLRRVRLDAAWIALVPLGLVSFLAYLAVKFDPGAMGRAQDTWGRRVTMPWEIVARYFDGRPTLLHGFGTSWTDLAVVVFFAAMVALCWWKLRPTYALYGTVMLGTFVASGSFISMPRYGLALFPVFMLLGRWGSDERRHTVIVSVSLLLAGLAMALFATTRWAG